MKTFLFATVMVLSSAAAFAQTTPSTADPNPATPAVTSSSSPAPSSPAKGGNSFTMAQAKSRIEAAGFTGVGGLVKGNDGVWRGQGTKNGSSGKVSLDYQGNVLPK
jgi:hypothetical protein